MTNDIQNLMQKYHECLVNMISKEEMLNQIKWQSDNEWQGDLPIVMLDLHMLEFQFKAPTDEYFFRLLNLEAARVVGSNNTIFNCAISAAKVAWNILGQQQLASQFLTEAFRAAVPLHEYNKLKFTCSFLKELFMNGVPLEDADFFKNVFSTFFSQFCKIPSIQFEQGQIVEMYQFFIDCMSAFPKEYSNAGLISMVQTGIERISINLSESQRAHLFSKLATTIKT